MQVEDIVKAIYELKSQEELDSVWEALKSRTRQLSVVDDAVIKSKLKVGDLVEFNARGRGIPQGIIKKMNPSKAQVKVQKHESVPPVIWNVPYGMLKKVK